MLRCLSLFSGIGSFEKALTNLGVKYEVVNYCEIDKYASKSYSAIHGVSESKNLWDITKVNVFNLPTNIDLLTYGFPCQDISLAGKQKGMFNEDGSLTRSGLFFKALDVIEYVKPKIAIVENVKALTSKKFSEQFKIVLDSLEKAGYHNYWKVLNAKDYGIPQNRERVFIVSIRKDIDHNMFEFPKPYSLEKRLKDFLEPHVDEKYYLSDKMISYLMGLNQSKSKYPRRKIFIDSLKMPNEKGIAKTITTKSGNRPTDNFIIEQDINHITKIRKLIPLECFRLMGFNDDDYIKCKKIKISDTQLYKQAGNSIVVDVLEEIFRMMLDDECNLLV